MKLRFFLVNYPLACSVPDTPPISLQVRSSVMIFVGCTAYLIPSRLSFCLLSSSPLSVFLMIFFFVGSSPSILQYCHLVMKCGLLSFTQNFSLRFQLYSGLKYIPTSGMTLFSSSSNHFHTSRKASPKVRSILFLFVTPKVSSLLKTLRCLSPLVHKLHRSPLLLSFSAPVWELAVIVHRRSFN